MQGNAPWLLGRPCVYTGPFRSNVAAFLRDHGQRVNAPFLKHVNVYLVRVHRLALHASCAAPAARRSQADGGAPVRRGPRLTVRAGRR
jgi:hypothetical protein